MRTLNTPFQPSLTQKTFVMYSTSVLMTLVGGVGNGDVGRIELRFDATNPPTTVRASMGGSLISIPNTLPAGETINSAVQGELSYVVSAGDFVEIFTVSGQGTATFSLDVVTEIPVG